MTAMEIARFLDAHGDTEGACRACTLAARDAALPPEERMEAAVYLLEHGPDYRIPYGCFLELHRTGHFREDIVPILEEAFYLPNEAELRERFRRNVRILREYPYLFRRDFPDFEALPLRFFPFEDGAYVPWDLREGCFREIVRVDAPTGRSFFQDLEKPVLAREVFSQYELDYLRENVRPSEWVGRENHIYLHYRDWGTFCAWLQVLDFRALAESRQAVFLIGEEIGQYPMDFQARFGIDYRNCPPRPVGIREIRRLIFHAQLSSHNGGDFFNEIFDDHPNLITLTSLFFTQVREGIAALRKGLSAARTPEDARRIFRNWGNPQVVEELLRLKHPTDKDLFVALYLGASLEGVEGRKLPDPTERIVPALFFQPHFGNMDYRPRVTEGGGVWVENREAESLNAWPVLREFSCIRTFVPLRRFTTSYAATTRFYAQNARKAEVVRELAEAGAVRPEDPAVQRLLVRGFLADPEERLWRESVVVRFEDGKLNPKAAFTALAAFLDIPYTPSMTRCSLGGVPDPVTPGNVVGFDPATVYRTYDEYAGESECRLLEYFLREEYRYYGYDFRYYDGAPMEAEAVLALLEGFATQDRHLLETERILLRAMETHRKGRPLTPAEEAETETAAQGLLEGIRRDRGRAARALLQNPVFVGKSGRPLERIPLLELDPALLEREIYR